MREVREETGLETEFVSLLSFRHMHGFRWSTDDIYFICLLKPLTRKVTIDDEEISASKWVDVSGGMKQCSVQLNLLTKDTLGQI